METTVLIDLGETWSVAEQGGRNRGPRRRWSLAGAAGLLALLLPAAAAAPSPALVPLAVIRAPAGASAVEIGPDAVFVGGRTDGHQQVRRYSMATGALRWSSPVADLPADPATLSGSLRYAARADALVVATFEPESTASQITVLDAGTGRQLWSSPGDLLWAPPPAGYPDIGETALLLIGGPARPVALRLVDLRSGRPVWARQVWAGAAVQLADWSASGPGLVLVVGPDGDASVLAYDSGAMLAGGRLGSLAGAGGSTDPTWQTSVDVVGDRLIATRATDTAAVLAAYALPDLTRLWQSTSGEFSGYPADCGPVLCVGQGDRLVGLDVDTGRIRWTAAGWQGASLLDGDRLLGYRPGPGERTGLLDGWTGRQLLDLGDWQPLGRSGATRLMSAPDVTDYRHTWFGVLDPRHRAVQPIGRLAAIGLEGCQLAGDAIACTTTDGSVSVWRYRA